MNTNQTTNHQAVYQDRMKRYLAEYQECSTNRERDGVRGRVSAYMFGLADAGVDTLELARDFSANVLSFHHIGFD